MAMKKKEKFHHGDLRNALVKAAVYLLDTEGERGVTIRAVARETGVSHAAPSNHFPNRQALMTALSKELFEDMSAYILSAVANASASPEARLLAFTDALMEYGLDHPARYKLLWKADIVNSEDQALQQTMDGLYDEFTVIVGDLYNSGSQDVETAAVALWSMCQGYTSMRLDGVFIPKHDTVSGLPRHKAMIRAYIDGLKKGAPKS